MLELAVTRSLAAEKGFRLGLLAHRPPRSSRAVSFAASSWNHMASETCEIDQQLGSCTATVARHNEALLRSLTKTLWQVLMAEGASPRL